MEQQPRDRWYYREKTAFAEVLGVSPQYLGDILHGRKRATPELAARIETVAKEYGLNLTRMDVMYPKESASGLMAVKK